MLSTLDSQAFVDRFCSRLSGTTVFFTRCLYTALSLKVVDSGINSVFRGKILNFVMPSLCHNSGIQKKEENTKYRIFS